MKNKVFGFFWILGSVQNFLLREGWYFLGKVPLKSASPPLGVSMKFLYHPLGVSGCQKWVPPPKGAGIFPGQQGRFLQKGHPGQQGILHERGILSCSFVCVCKKWIINPSAPLQNIHKPPPPTMLEMGTPPEK